MPAKSTTLQDPINAAQTLAENVSEAASQVKDNVSDLGQTAAEKLDENRGKAAERLESAASTLHEKARSLPTGGNVAALAHSAADKMNFAARYVREHDVKSMMADVEQLVKNNPGPSLLAAAVVGFLVARAFSPNDKG